MRSLFLVATISALAWARPETYRETEDFQFARSSSDEGSKSGYYGAQRGNMAGNYERAHNMDSLAQHQMSGAINQVEGELGDASKTRAGSVYTAANSRGVYGSGHYDLSNLQGRNFGESSSVDSSHTSDSSHSSLSSAYNQQHLQNSDWRSHSQRTGFGASNQLGQASLRAADTGYGAYAGSDSHSTGYQSASGYNSASGYRYQNNYDQSNLNGQSADFGAGDQSRRYTVVTPVRLVGRPGTQIAIPVYAQAGPAYGQHVYDARRGSSSFGQTSSNSQNYASQRASTYDQTAANSEAEVLNNNQQHISSIPSVPVTDGKHYSSSYNYHKAWERRSETTDLPVPVAPTVSPLPKHSELYEDVQGASSSDNLQQASSQASHAGNAYTSANRYNSHSEAGSRASRHQSDYSSQHRSQADANSDAYAQLGTYGSRSGLSPLVDSQPKSYQSSYSYHKSWEKQGDPYVIVPETNGEQSQRVVAGNSKTAASAQRYGSHQHYTHGAAVDCNTLCRARRAVRSYRTEDYYQQNQEDLGQQAQSGWEDLGQQSQNLEDLGQQTQQSWGNLQQQSSQKLEDLGQQTQQSLDNFQQQTQPQKLEDLGQQTQQSWGNLQQQSGPQKLEDLGQQTQQSWGNFQQQSRPQKLEDFGQQTQGKSQEFEIQEPESHLEDLGQQTQDSWDKSNIEQQASGQNLHDLGQQTQGQWDKLETDRQQSQQTFTNLDNLGQQTQNGWDNLESLGQQTQQNGDGLSNIQQQNVPEQTEDLGQQTQNKWDGNENLGQQVQTQWNNINTINKTRHTDTTNTEQQSQTQFQSVDLTKPNRVHDEDTFNNENSNINNPNHPAFWSLTNVQKHENTHYNQQNTHHNSYSNSQNYGASWHEQQGNTNNAHSTNNNTLQSLWDKIDNMEQQSELTSNENPQNSQNSFFGQESTYLHESNGEHRHNSSYTQDQQEIHYSGYQPPIVFNNTPNKPKSDHQSTTEKTKDDNLPEKPEAAEIGRGDIGPEDDSPTDITTPKSLPYYLTYVTDKITQITPIKIPDEIPEEIESLSLSRGTDEDSKQSDLLSIYLDDNLPGKPEAAEIGRDDIGPEDDSPTDITTPKSLNYYLTYIEKLKHGKITQITPIKNPEEIPEEIEALSLSRGTDEDSNQSDSLSVLSVSQQTWLEDQRQRSATEHQTSVTGSRISRSTTTTTSTTTSRSVPNEDKTLESSIHTVNQHKHEKQSESGQSSSVGAAEIGRSDIGPVDDSPKDITTPKSLPCYQTHETITLNITQIKPVKILEEIPEEIEALSLSRGTDENMGQEFEGFGQQSQNLSQHNVQQLGQHSQNFDQQNTGQELEDFGQRNQQNLDQFQNLGQQNQNSDQQSTGQDLVDFGQQSQDLSQQNVQQLENLGQHSQNFNQQNKDQQLVDFGQQSQDLSQHNVQQFEKIAQHSQNIDQQSTVQQLEDFGQQNQDLNQQNLHQFEDLSQQTQNLNQHEAREFVPSIAQPVQEQKITPVIDHGSQSHPKQDVEILPPSVTITENPGFWKSVGNKFTSAKDSVASWFKS